MTRWLLCCFVVLALSAQPFSGCAGENDTAKVVTGAERLKEYLPLLKDKKVGLLINQTSVVGETSLLDTLLALDVNVKKIFVPEHGFRGEAQAGETIKDEKDKKTKLPIVSLYGDNKKPTEKQLKHIDVLIYDLQDVGVRFYTYISTLQYAMEACAENGVQLIVLDRPDPNGYYIDGPVLDTSLRSFVGMQPIPVVYAMTAGEYAKMLVGEKWFEGADKLDMKIIPCLNYDHTTMYHVPIAPSPNLRNMAAIYCYPILCLFEGTVVSVGRGSDKPFQQWGHPAFKGKTQFFFRPVAVWGQKKWPLYAYQECYGQALALDANEAIRMVHFSLRLTWLMRAYSWYPDKDKFFNDYFEKLAGTRELRKQIQDGATEEQIYATWQPGIKAFKKIRKKYLLYTDFE